MPNDNDDLRDYNSPIVDQFKLPRSGFLVGLPIAFALAVWVLLALNGVQISGSSGSLGWVTLLIAVGYVAIPNLIMVSMRQHENRRGGDTEKATT